MNLLKQELRDHSMYDSILNSIAGGRSRLNKYYYLFSKNGFTIPVLDAAKELDILTLVTIDDIFNL